MPQANSTFSMPRWISPAASVSTLPCWLVTMRASSGLRCSSSSRIRKKMSARLDSDVARHAGKASAATATAASISSVVAKSTSWVCSPVAGLKTGPVRPDSPGTTLPPIQ